MSGDSLKKVIAGQPLEIPAATWNLLLEVAGDYLARKHAGGTGRVQAPSPATGIVKIKNASGAALDRFAILGLDSVLFTPTDNLDEFKNNFAFSGSTPAAGHAGKFAVLLEPAPTGGIVRAMTAGVCPVQVNVTDAAHGYADVKAGDATQLQSGAAGSATVLWKESGTGTKWAIVRLGSTGGATLSDDDPADVAAAAAAGTIADAGRADHVHALPLAAGGPLVFVAGLLSLLFSDGLGLDGSNRLYVLTGGGITIVGGAVQLDSVGPAASHVLYKDGDGVTMEMDFDADGRFKEIHAPAP